MPDRKPQRSPGGTTFALRSVSGKLPCAGVLQQLGMATALLADQKLLINLQTSSVEDYYLLLKKTVATATPGGSYHCRSTAHPCRVCLDQSRLDLNAIIYGKLVGLRSCFPSADFAWNA